MKTVENVAIVVIALAVLFGGAGLLAQIALLRGPALAMLAMVTLAQLVSLARRRSGGDAQLRYARDVAFLAALGCAFAFVAHPARWSLGASIAGAEFGLVLELMARFSGGERPA